MTKRSNGKLRKNPYASLHRKLIEFTENAELDEELTLRNEYLHMENMILRGMYFKRKDRLKLTEAEKQELAVPASKMRGRSKVKVSLLSALSSVYFRRIDMLAP